MTSRSSARGTSGEVLLQIGEAVVVVVGKLQLDRLEVEVARFLVGDAAKAQRGRGDIPRIGRDVAAVELVEDGEPAVARRVRRVADVLSRRRAGHERRNLRRGKRGRRGLFVAEHDVELPAVRHAVLVAVGIARQQGVQFPGVVGVHPQLADVGETVGLLEVAADEVLVEGGELLRVRAVGRFGVVAGVVDVLHDRGGVGRLGVEAE